jgi:hypothetical protein
MEIINGIFSESFWWIAPILVTMTTALAGLINQGFKVPYAWLKQLISWVLGAGLSCGAWGLKLISFGDPVWLGIVSLCLVVGLASNGFYDIPTIRNWISTWFVKTDKLDTVLDIVGNLIKSDTVPVTEAEIKSAPIVVAEYKDEATPAVELKEVAVLKSTVEPVSEEKPKKKSKPKSGNKRKPKKTKEEVSKTE